MKLKNSYVGNKLAALGIKYLPVFMLILLTLHVGMLMLGIYEPISVCSAALMLVMFVFLLSIRFEFCILHKTLIGYMAMIGLCITFQKFGIFGKALPIFRGIMLVFGIVLIVLMLIKTGKSDEC